MRASIALSSALFAVAMAQDYNSIPAPADGQSTTVVPQAYQSYVPEPTTLCVDETSTITITKPTTITLTRMQTMTWSEYTTTECEEIPESTEAPAPLETETPCANSTIAYVPTPSAAVPVPYAPPASNNSSAQAPAATPFVNGAGRSTVASGVLVAIFGLAAFFL